MFSIALTVFMLSTICFVVNGKCDKELGRDLIYDLIEVMQKRTGGDYTLCKTTRKPIVAFAAYQAVSKQLHGNEIIRFQKTWTNTGNGFDVRTSKFTAPVAGHYQFSATVMSTYQKRLHAHIWKNNDQIIGVNPGRGYDSATSVVILELMKGDQVYLRHDSGSYTHNDGPISDDTNNWCSLSGFLIAQ